MHSNEAQSRAEALFKNGGGSLAARSAVLLEGLRNVVSQKRTKFYHGLRRQIHKEGNLVDR
jgi:hypothetical protein